MGFEKNGNETMKSQHKDQQILRNNQADLKNTDLHMDQSSKLPDDPLHIPASHLDTHSVGSDDFDALFSDDAEFELALRNNLLEDDTFIDNSHLDTNHKPPNNEYSTAKDDINLPQDECLSSTDYNVDIDLPKDECLSPIDYNDDIGLPKDECLSPIDYNVDIDLPQDECLSPIDYSVDIDLPEGITDLLENICSPPMKNTVNIDLPEIVTSQAVGNLKINQPLPIIEIDSAADSREISLSPPPSLPTPLSESSSSSTTTTNTAITNADIPTITKSISASSSTAVRKEMLPPRRISTRQRSEIQLKPYTLEGARYAQLLGRAPSSSKLSNTQIMSLNDDDDDQDFTLTQTQPTYEDLEEIFENSLMENLHRIQERNKQASLTRTDSSGLDSLSNAFDGLSLPNTSRVKDTVKKKPITFQKKGRKKIHPKLSLPSRAAKPPQEEIFNFDLYEKEKTQKTSTTTPIVINDNVASNSRELDMDYDQDMMDIDDIYDGNDYNEDSVNNEDNEDSTNFEDVDNNDDGDDDDEDEDEDEDEDMPVFKRPPLHKRGILLSDSDDESDIETERNTTRNNQEMTQEEIDAVFDFPTYSHRRHLRKAEDMVVPIVNDESEYPEIKRTRMSIKDLKAHTLKNVLPASFYKLNESKFREEIQQRKLSRQQQKKVHHVTSATTSHSDRVQRDTEDVFAAFRSESDEEEENTAYTSNASFFSPPPSVGTSKEKEKALQARNDFFNTIANPSSSVTSYKGKEKVHQDKHDFSSRRTNIPHSVGVSIGKNTVPFTRNDFSNVVTTPRSSSTSGIAHISSASPTTRPLQRRVSDPNSSVPGRPLEAIEYNRIPGQRYHPGESIKRIPSASSTTRQLPRRLSNLDLSAPRHLSETNGDNRMPRQRYNYGESTHIPSASSTTRQSPRRLSDPDPSAPRRPSEATGDNRTPKQPYRPGEKINMVSAQPDRSATKSSFSASSSACVKRPGSNAEITNNSEPQKKKRKPKKTPHNVYMLPPYYTPEWLEEQGLRIPNNNTIPYPNPNPNTAGTVQERARKRALDDICVNTKRSKLWVRSGLAFNLKTAALIRAKYEQQVSSNSAIQPYSLESVAKKVYEIMDNNFRRLSGSEKTVYLHHKLLLPILNPNFDTKLYYANLKENYSELVFFEKDYQWSQFSPFRREIKPFDGLFKKLFRDFAEMRRRSKINPETIQDELPGHDHFYVFISLYISQWIPLHDAEDQQRSVNLLARHIGGLTGLISKLSEAEQRENIPWKPIIKLMLFILDWSCRLYKLGAIKVICSVTNCTAILLDILVSIGIKPLKDDKEEYVIEAWYCLFHVMSVSYRNSGYGFKARVFVDQMTSSIQRKLKREVEKRRTIYLWVETLTDLLTNHIK